MTTTVRKLDPQPVRAKPTDVKPKDNVGFLGNLSVSQKLTTAGLILGIPLALTGYTLVNRNLTDLSRANKAVTVGKVLKPLQELQKNLRNISTSKVSEISSSDLDALSASSSELMTLANNTGDEQVLKFASSLKSQIDNVVTATKNRTIKDADYYKFTRNLLDTTIAGGFNVLADEGGLLNTTSLEGNKVSALAAKTLPRSLPQLGAYSGLVEVMGEAANSNTGGKIPDTQRAVGEEDLRVGRAQLASLKSEMDILMTFPDAKARLSKYYDQAISDTSTAFDFLDNNVIKPEKVKITNQQIFDSALPYLKSQYAAFAATADYMSELFTADAARARRNTYLTLAALLLILLLGFLLFRLIARAITQPLTSLTLASQRLSAGDFTTKVPITSRDELATLARSFNDASEQLHANELRSQQEREEAERLQNNIGEFLDVTMDIAEGDLTKRGKVTEDVLGNVVDSINLMAEELAEVLKDVQSASVSVTGGSRAMLSTTEQINEGTQMTAAEAERVAQQVQELTAAIREMAQSAQTSAQTARQALLASQQGQEAVSGTLEGMQNIRTASQNVAQQIQGLSQRSEQIQEIVESISHIASQTNLLALHASIEAAGAGEAGQRFNIVAQEVSQLADLSAQEAQRITALVRNVQNEIGEALSTVSASTRQVEQGYRVAGTAGERLREIGELSERSATLAEQISETTLEQVQGVEQVGQAVVQINTIAQQSAQSVEQGRSAAEQLQQLANRLNASLSRFRLPS